MNQDIFVLIEHLQGQVAEISYLLLAAAKALAEAVSGNIVAVLLGYRSQELASDLAADQVLYIDHSSYGDFNPDAYRRALAKLIREHTPRLVLFGDTSIGVEVAGPLSASLGLPLVSNCCKIRPVDGRLKFVCQAYGGKIIVEGDLPAPTALVTLIPGGYRPEQGRSDQPPQIVLVEAGPLEEPRVILKQYFLPEAGDVDISKQSLLVAVGRGIQNQANIELAEDLANALGGVVCSSRPVVDQGWLPSTRLVGKSGRRVKPKIFLALGISGAPEHVEAITASEMIIAVNTDPAAPIFDVAQYGAEVDILELLPVLAEAVQRVKVG